MLEAKKNLMQILKEQSERLQKIASSALKSEIFQSKNSQDSAAQQDSANYKEEGNVLM
jgi:hypothetical protein